MRGISKQMSLTCIFAALLIFVMSANISAQSRFKSTKTPIQKGVWAMQFEINQDFDLSSFQGAMISVKKHTSRSKAWRLGLDINTSLSENDSQNIYNDSTVGWSDGESDRYSFDINLQRIFYASPRAKVSLFYGFGPSAGYTYSKNKSTSKTPTSNRLSITKTKTFDVGLVGVLGVEWFFSKNMSLLGEYGADIIYLWSKNERTQTNPNGDITYSKGTSKRFDFDNILVKFGLSVYF